MSNTPSDAEIEKLAAEHIKAFAQFTGAGGVRVEGEVAFARAALAKWGAPQPAPAPAPAPLSDAQIAAAMTGYGPVGIGFPSLRRVSRAIERAHGITQKGGQHGTE